MFFISTLVTHTWSWKDNLDTYIVWISYVLRPSSIG